MSYSSKGYTSRAEECVRLANQTADEMIQRELLTLRQTYLKTAAKLGETTPAWSPPARNSQTA